MEEFNRWKNKYVVECTYDKSDVQHFGSCDKPSRYIKNNYSIKRKFEFKYDLLRFIDKYSNIEINNQTQQMFKITENMCNLGNKDCIHTSKYKLVYIEIIENPIFVIKNRLVNETNFSSIKEFEEAVTLGKRNKEELNEYKRKIEEEKVKKLSSLFLKGR